MKSIFFSHSVNVIGGAERVTLSIIEGVANEYQAVLLAPSDKDLGKHATTAGAIFEPVECGQPDWQKPFKSLKQQWRYFRLIKKYQPLLVHTGDLLALRSLQPICQLLKVPLICHVHFPYEKSFMTWCFKNRYSPARFIFCSEELKDNLVPYLSTLCPTATFHVIHNGVDTNYFFPQSPTNNAKPHIGIIANLQYRKGHDDFLHMAKILTDQGVDAHYDIIGGDILQEPREPILKELAVNLGIADRVTFHGQISDVRAALASLDIFVCASHEEAFPISILEAMACGKIIISTNVNGIPEMLSHNLNSLLCDSHSPTQLANAVFKILSQDEKKHLLISEARKNVELFFSKKVFLDKIKSMY